KVNWQPVKESNFRLLIQSQASCHWTNRLWELEERAGVEPAHDRFAGGCVPISPTLPTRNGGLPRTRTSRRPLPCFAVGRVTAAWGERSPGARPRIRAAIAPVGWVKRCADPTSGRALGLAAARPNLLRSRPGASTVGLHALTWRTVHGSNVRTL